MSVLYLFFKLTKTYENSEQTRYVISLSNGLIAWFLSSYDKPQKVRGDFSIPVRITIIVARKSFCRLDLRVSIFCKNPICPLSVRYFENAVRREYQAPCFSFCRKPNAPSIASDTLACAVWNIWEYTFKVVPELLCPNAPETVVTSSPAEIRELAAKCRNECKP